MSDLPQPSILDNDSAFWLHSINLSIGIYLSSPFIYLVLSGYGFVVLVTYPGTFRFIIFSRGLTSPILIRPFSHVYSLAELKSKIDDIFLISLSRLFLNTSSKKSISSVASCCVDKDSGKVLDFCFVSSCITLRYAIKYFMIYLTYILSIELDFKDLFVIKSLKLPVDLFKSSNIFFKLHNITSPSITSESFIFGSVALFASYDIFNESSMSLIVTFSISVFMYVFLHVYLIIAFLISGIE